ncbi:fumarylacetoacetate (FAA) hydrolase [Sulfodiicoccus acidiphilus]|uniref:Fumarylacetoacetate (FAA) hydrolase n=1 Tax=Sulfodiicoccus acidiphilus TaxID=1670455 RepID=A0A348B4Z0_9CREN|nr:fumarylacetoacetate hydrolase family protein [Sulfodiicoccus acidiphilus]BBD73242.1 fumarylacetoacetate (FAA) hydrolase [Sulfodiicoccus acidiphilus]
MGGWKITKPLDPPEVWGAGISYEAARGRYTEDVKDKGMTIYDMVYNAERPEIFFKATANRCVGHMEPIRVRSDSSWTLPEPELGVVLSSSGRPLAFTVVDDVSARDIESENPLYLPQSKIYAGSCAVGPFLVTPDEVGDPYSLEVNLRILRGGKEVFSGRTNTSRMRRRIDEQVKYLTRDNPVPDGTLLSTGTGIVPGRDVDLREGDVVEITIDKLGTQVTPVVKGKG